MKKTIIGAIVHICPDCDGTGQCFYWPVGSESSEDGIEIKCKRCRGTGWIKEYEEREIAS